MSVEKLQEKIRKTKNPSVIDLSVTASQIPQSILDQEPDIARAAEKYAKELLTELKGIVPAVRFSYGYYALMGGGGIQTLNNLLQAAKACGYYVLVDAYEQPSLQLTDCAAEFFLNLPCDGLVVSGYAGSDVLKPYADRLQQCGKSLFVVLRNANRSASQLQDLMTGSRLVHIAAADAVNRLGEGIVGRSGYSQIGGVSSANAADSLRTLRSKYKNMFLLVDGYDYSNANAKNCSFAFDKLGHGAAVCARESVVGAWMESGDTDYISCVVAAVERMKKNLTRYITVL